MRGGFRGFPHHPSSMAPSPGTPVGGERARQRSHSPRGGRGKSSYGCGWRTCRCSPLPVPGCLHGDATKARGWASIASIQAHIDAHLAGAAGDLWIIQVPDGFEQFARLGYSGISVGCHKCPLQWLLVAQSSGRHGFSPGRCGAWH